MSHNAFTYNIYRNEEFPNTIDMLKVKLLNPHARLPQRQTVGSAGYDIYSAGEYVVLAGQKAIISTGIAIELPKCPIAGHIYCFQIMSRSGLSVNYSIEKGAGLIDADYTGEIKIILYNHSRPIPGEPEKGAYRIGVGDRVAQGVIVAVAVPDVVEITNLGHSQRGASGFGSTGR